MRRIVLCLLLLAMALSVTGCLPVSGDGAPSPAEEEPKLAATQPDDAEAVTAAEPVWMRQHQSVWGREPETVSAEFERISGAAACGMTTGQELLLLDFMDCYYQSVCSLQAIDCSALFADRAQSDYHRTVWRTLAAIRQESPIDLHAGSYSYSLRCAALDGDGDTAALTLLESSVVYFDGLEGMPSEQWNVKHTFRLQRAGGDRWLIAEHVSDDNPYYSADYDADTDTDRNLPRLLACIRARQDDPRTPWTPKVTWDHDYDRDAALDYMLTYSAKRNPAYRAYDDVGGNCMNFGSQVLSAGGIPPVSGGYETGWYYFSSSNVTLPWVNVGGFLDLAASHTGSGLVAAADAPYFTGEVGDIITMGVEEPRNHTTVICGILTDDAGQTVDYLLCSNTANLRNYPASAYYYANRQLTKILGWND